MLNRTVLIGRLTKDPELKQTPSGKEVCTLTLAVDRAFTNAAGEREADFFPIVVWGKQASACNKYLAKGKLAAVDGRTQLRWYEDKNGSKRLAVDVIAESVKFLSPQEKRQESQQGSPLDEMDDLDELPL